MVPCIANCRETEIWSESCLKILKFLRHKPLGIFDPEGPLTWG